MPQHFPLHCDKPTISVAFGINRTRGDDINPDVPRPQLLGQCHREGVHRTLGRRIERRVRHGILTRDRADIDDAASTCREMLQSFLDSEDLSSRGTTRSTAFCAFTIPIERELMTLLLLRRMLHRAGTFASNCANPSDIVGCVRIASRKTV
jgi:hypothetical protein